MVATDHPLKLLVAQFTVDFATWLLQTEVVSAEQLNVELATESMRLDSVLRVLPADGEPVMLHISRIRQEPNRELRSGLFNALLSLTSDEECLAMLEKVLEEDEELLLDTPYLQRQRERGWEEGRKEGRKEGLAEGQIQGLRIAIRDILLSRSDPPYSKVKELENRLAAIDDMATVKKLIPVAVQSESFDAFLQHLAGQVSSGDGAGTHVDGHQADDPSSSAENDMTTPSNPAE